jgi:hypothetical protein
MNPEFIEYPWRNDNVIKTMQEIITRLEDTVQEQSQVIRELSSRVDYAEKCSDIAQDKARDAYRAAEAAQYEVDDLRRKVK